MKFLDGQSTKEKVFSIIRIVICLAVIVIAALQLLDIWENAINFALPLMAIVMVFQTIQFWKSSRVTAIISLCSAVVIAICSIVIWIV